MPGIRNRLHLTLAALMSALVATGAAGAIAAEERPLRELEEVWVEGKRLSRSIADVEDDFFKLYNKVNRNNQYDIYCGYMSLERGSMIMRRVCMPEFVTYNMPSMGGRSYSTMTGAGCSMAGSCSMWVSSPPPGPPLVPTALLLMERRAAYAQNVLDVINSDERLMQKYLNLVDMYEAMRQTQRRYRTALDEAGEGASRWVATWRSKGPRAP